jgi:hypothetical protein
MGDNKPLSMTVEQSEFCKGIWRAHHNRGLMEAYQQAREKWPIDHGVFLGEMGFVVSYEGQDLLDKVWPMAGEFWPEGTPVPGTPKVGI